MPIHPENRDRYPADWPDISKRIRHERAGDRCECSGQCGTNHALEAVGDQDPDDRCRAENGRAHPVTGSVVVLTVAHLDHTPENVDDANLLAACPAMPPPLRRRAPRRESSAPARRAARRRRPPDVGPRTVSMIRADARNIPIAAGTVDLVVTSPPYLAQRRYGVDDEREIGREATVAEYVTLIADVFDELRRIMKPATSAAWLNIGDKANNSGGAGGDWAKKNRLAMTAGGGPGRFRDPAHPEAGYIDVPGRVLHELMRRGWRLRATIIWDKGREAPESLAFVRRPRVAHEMIYYLVPWERPRRANRPRPKFYPSALTETGSVWHFPPGGSGPAHLAPFPDELARRCILPCTLPGDLVFDPFGGSGTVPRVAAELGRRGIATDIYAGRPDLVHGLPSREDTPT